MTTCAFRFPGTERADITPRESVQCHGESSGGAHLPSFPESRALAQHSRVRAHTAVASQTAATCRGHGAITGTTPCTTPPTAVLDLVRGWWHSPRRSQL